MAKVINIEIDKKGNVSIELDGYHGQGCSQTMDALTAGQESNRTPKPEMYEPTTNNQYNVQGN